MKEKERKQSKDAIKERPMVRRIKVAAISSVSENDQNNKSIDLLQDRMRAQNINRAKPMLTRISQKMLSVQVSYKLTMDILLIIANFFFIVFIENE